jgi:hypothetical protein
MPAVIRCAALALCAVPTILPAQDVRFDGSLAYSARDEVFEERSGREIDNDILRLTAALSWPAADGQMRGALEFGVGNDDFDGNYPGFGGVELAFARNVGAQRYTLGGRVRTAEDLTTTTELAYVIEHLGEGFDLRGMVGVQSLSDPDLVVGRDGSSAFALGEIGLYLTDNLVVSAGLMADTDGEVFGAGVEFRPEGTGGISFFLEYGEAFDEYRDVAGYDEFIGGIRIVPGTSSLRDARQGNLARVLQRFVEVQ